jgi:hypothetical protein
VFRQWGAARPATAIGSLVVGTTASTTPSPLLPQYRAWYRTKARNVSQAAVKSVALADGVCRASEQVLTAGDGGVAELESFVFPIAQPGLRVEVR